MGWSKEYCSWGQLFYVLQLTLVLCSTAFTWQIRFKAVLAVITISPDKLVIFCLFQLTLERTLVLIWTLHLLFSSRRWSYCLQSSITSLQGRCYLKQADSFSTLILNCLFTSLYYALTELITRSSLIDWEVWYNNVQSYYYNKLLLHNHW